MENLNKYLDKNLYYVLVVLATINTNSILDETNR
jgi:hypothetical protein